MGELIEPPSPDEQKKILQKLLSKSVIVGETWYLISMKWFKSLKEFLGMEDHFSQVSHPGPIDNRELIDNEKKTLRQALEMDLDYTMVSEKTWEILCNWYGIIEDTEPIKRKAIEYPNEPFVEVYKFDLKCILNYDHSTVKIVPASRAETSEHLLKKLRDVFNVSLEKEARLCVIYPKNMITRDLKDTTVGEMMKNKNDVFVIVTKSADGTWNDSLDNTIKTNSDRPSYQSRQFPETSSMHSRFNSRYIAQSRPAAPGLCGLSNLGNTCFMNSVLQCMSNVPVITEYFLSERHLKELNVTNPLGMKGEIARTYGELVMKMWSGNHSEVTPTDFKIQVGKFNPSFSGFQQHDSQELLTFLLDGLHEDLNRIKQKPYIEISNQAGKDEKIAAMEAWENYKKRNDSVIVDTFHGLLRSTVICPECEHTSVTFDPFCYLSLPLPYKTDRNLTITYVPYDGSLREIKYRLTLARNHTIRELCQQVAEKTKTAEYQLIVAEITQHHFHKFYGYDDSIDHIEEKDVINVFELPIPYDSDDCIIVPVCFWELCKPEDKYMPNHLFGVPFLITVPKKPITYDQLNGLLLEKMQRHFPTLPNIKSQESSSTASNNSTSCFNVNGSEATIEDNLKQCCAVSTSSESSIYKLFYTDFGTSADPKKLEFNDEPINLAELIGASDGPRYGRKVLVLQFTSAQRKEFFHEKSATHDNIINNQPFNKDKEKSTINDCLHLFTKSEKLSATDAWFCPNCHKHQRATKKFDLWKLPKVLIVHLKRFSYCRRQRSKIESLVKCPITDLCMDNYIINKEKPSKVYDLAGICNHYGNMGAGHYIAVCKNKDNGCWYTFDDSSVSPISQDEILTRAAYVLFYVARDCNKPPDNMNTD